MGYVLFSVIIGTIQLAFWAWSAGYTVDEITQGEVYRILYIHVPSAVAAFLVTVVLVVFSVLSIRKPEKNYILGARASAEVGAIFTVLTLISGSIWGKPTWGTWWTWDARLTTTLLLAVLYCGYLLLYHSVRDRQTRVRVCAVLSFLILADVPIIYKSVSWWRTLHQPPSMSLSGTSLSPEILAPLLFSILLTLVVAGWFIRMRWRNLQLMAEIKLLAFHKLRSVY